MNRLSGFLMTGVLAASLVGVSSSAEAGRTASARPAPARAQSARATRAPRATNAQASARLSNPAKDPKHLAKVNARTKLLSRYTLEGWPSKKPGEVDFAAAFAELHPAGGIQHKETVALSYGEGRDRSQRVAVSGVKDGMWRGHLIGTVSTHDMSHLDWPQFNKQIKQRIDADRVQVSYDYGPGTPRTVLAKGLKSGPATAVEVAVPLNKNGITRIIYDRTDASGYAVGSSAAYVGRIVELSWSGN